MNAGECCVEALRTLSFECAGIGRAEEHLGALLTVLGVADLRSLTCRAARRALLEGSALATKRFVSVDMVNGETVTGKFIGYKPAAVRMLTIEGCA